MPRKRRAAKAKPVRKALARFKTLARAKARHAKGGLAARKAPARLKALAKAGKSGLARLKTRAMRAPRRLARLKTRLKPGKQVSPTAIVVLAIVLLALVLAFAYFGTPLFKPALKAPASASAVQKEGGIVLSWDGVQGAVAYRVFKSNAPNQAGAAVATTNFTSFSDSNISDSVGYFYSIKAIDAGGREGGSATAFALADFTPPEALQISIDNNAQFTHVRPVNLSLYASGASECRVGEEGVWQAWEPFAAENAVTLSAGDGSKRVLYQCRDEVGNIALPVSAEIFLDETPPLISIESPSQEAAFPPKFTAAFSARDASGLYCRASVDSLLVFDARTASGADEFAQVNAGEGTHSFEVVCWDDAGLQAGKIVSFAVSSPQVIYGTPNKPSLSVNHGEEYTDAGVVTLYLNAPGSSECRFWNEEESTGAEWEPFIPVKVWKLASGDGLKSVFAQCKNAYGSSERVGDTIFMDTVRPQPVKDLTARAGRNGTISLSWSPVKDGLVDGMGSGIAGYEIYRSAVAFDGFLKIGSSGSSETNFIDRTAVNGGEYAYKAYGRDKAGNQGMEGTEARAVSDADPPSVFLSSPVNGANYAGVVEMAFSASDAKSRTLLCQYSLDGSIHQIGYESSGAVNKAGIDAPLGSHAVFVSCDDEAGNAGASKTISFNIVQYA